MALSLKLSRTGINSIGTEMYLSDVTGTYAGDNIGGWGVPNPLRAEKALLVQGIQRMTTTDNVTEFLEYDPETVENFTLLTPVDGYYEIYMIAVDKIVPIIEGQYGWTSVSGLVQLVGGVLVSKTVEEVYLDVLFLDKVSFKTVMLAHSSILRNHKLLEYVTKLKAQNSDRGHNRDIAVIEEQYTYVKTLLEGARLFWCSSLYMESQSVVESLNELIKEDEQL